MTMEQEYELLRLLKLLPGANNYDGDVSVQVQLKLSNGRILRIGRTDDDCSEQKGLWFDLDYTFNVK